ncbi:hypothetical protein LZ32DRAFT_622198 [Colletotrichum eremochloae]|nr:hypothetical protein LZ32DRAFT_622198 [Colletotrichum eremochloae]
MANDDETPFLVHEKHDIETGHTQYEKRSSLRFKDALKYWYWVVILGLTLCIGLLSKERLSSSCNAYVRPTEIPGILPVIRTRQETIEPFFQPDQIFPNGSYFPRYSDYVGPASPEMDKLWADLDGPNLMAMNAVELGEFASQAMKNPVDDTTYVTSLQVFHQLHCLRAIQKALYPESYDHCMELIRRTITCLSDATPILYYVPNGTSFSSAEDSGNLRSLPHVHTCRDFDDITQWAKQREFQ